MDVQKFYGGSCLLNPIQKPSSAKWKRQYLFIPHEQAWVATIYIWAAVTFVCGFTALTGFWLWEPRFLIFLLSWPGCICLLYPRWERLQYFWGLRMLPDRPVFQSILWAWSHGRCLHPVLRSTGRYPLPVHRWVALLTAHRPRQRACRYKNAVQISSLLSSRFLWAVWAIVAKCFPICSFLSQNYSLIF